jgi:hypothetical protein
MLALRMLPMMPMAMVYVPMSIPAPSTPTTTQMEMGSVQMWMRALSMLTTTSMGMEFAETWTHVR